MSEDIRKIKVGDVVRLRVGGPDMVVDSLDFRSLYTRGAQARLLWFNDGENRFCELLVSMNNELSALDIVLPDDA